MTPFFSIIIPSYNRAHLLPRAIESMLQQSFQDFELIIVDDGSTDNTTDVLNRFGEDPRIKSFKQPNQGVCAARNQGSRMASGTFLGFLDSDDYVSADWLYEFHQVLKNTQADAAFCHSALVDEQTGKKVEFVTFQACNTRHGRVLHSALAGTFFIHRDRFVEMNGYNEALRYSENMELINRLLFYYTTRVAYVEKILITFGNSLNSKVRHGKFPQSLMKQSLETLIACNKEFWTFNKGKLVHSLRRLVVASIVTGEYKTAWRHTRKGWSIKPKGFFKISLLLLIAPVYRFYLLSIGFRK